MIGQSIQELAEIVGGRVRLGDMPPLGGAWEPTGRVVVDLTAISDGDVLLASADQIAANRCCIDEAFSRGALGVIATGKAIEPWPGKFSIQVEDTQWALWQLARSSRQHFDGRVIGVAGHVGKSTTVAMIDTILSIDRVSCGYDASVHAESQAHATGDALAVQILGLRDDADFALFELSARAKGELDTAAHLACPHIAVTTAIEPSLFGDETADELAPREYHDELLSALPDDGCAIRCGDAPTPTRHFRGAKQLTYGRSGRCDVQATHVLASDGTLVFVVDGQLARMQVTGRHHLSAALAAWCVGRACGVRDADIAARLEKFQPLAHRTRTMRLGDVTLIDDAASKCPAAARAGLAVLQQMNVSGKRFAICGEFRGSAASETAYRRLGRDCVTVGGADVVIAVGSGASAIAAGAYENGMPNSSCIVFAAPVNALCELRSLFANGNVVLATAVEPSLADALVATFQINQQRTAA